MSHTRWMRCPYDADLCGADATLTDFQRQPDDSWTGRLECANNHVFHLRQDPRDLVDIREETQ